MMDARWWMLDNAQVDVYAALICRGFYCLMDAVLYLPEKWCDQKKADIPVEKRTHKTKIELAYEMILHTRNVLKVPFKWFNFDSFYGRNFTRYQVKGKATSVDQVMLTLTEGDFVQLSVRITKEGNAIKTSYHVCTVHLVIKEHGIEFS